MAFVIGIGFTGSFMAGLKFAETTAFCTSCHEMSTPLQEFSQSSVHHTNEFGIQATCGDCHVPRAFIPGLMRHIAAYKEVWGHLTGKLNTPAKYEAQRPAMAQMIWDELKANDSAECRSCHTPAAMALKQQPAAASDAHSSLATSGLTCIDCHRGVAHTLPPGS